MDYRKQKKQSDEIITEKKPVKVMVRSHKLNKYVRLEKNELENFRAGKRGV